MTYPQLPDLFDPIAWWSMVDGTRTAIIDSASDTRYSYRDVDRDAVVEEIAFVAEEVALDVIPVQSARALTHENTP